MSGGDGRLEDAIKRRIASWWERDANETTPRDSRVNIGPFHARYRGRSRSAASAHQQADDQEPISKPTIKKLTTIDKTMATMPRTRPTVAMVPP